MSDDQVAAMNISKMSREELEKLAEAAVRAGKELEKICNSLIRGAAAMSGILALARANPGRKFRVLRDEAITDVHQTMAGFAALVLPTIDWDQP